MFTQSRRTIVHDSRFLRFHVHKEHKSASLLIPSTGRDKLSPLMKSFHGLQAVGEEPVRVDCTHTDANKARPCAIE